jgi:hypothetical protein
MNKKLACAAGAFALSASVLVSTAWAGPGDEGDVHGTVEPTPDDCFTPADLRGGYAMSAEIVLANGTRVFEIGRFLADGKGKATAEMVVSAPGGQTARESATCSYLVAHSGMGQMDCTSGEGEKMVIHFVLGNAGKEFRLLSTGNPQQILSGTARRQ